MLLTLVGLGLMVYMIVTESEPGALPLLLMVVGMGWIAIALFRSRSRAGEHRAE
jgi:hypothetical protein